MKPVKNKEILKRTIESLQEQLDCDFGAYDRVTTQFSLARAIKLLAKWERQERKNPHSYEDED